MIGSESNSGPATYHARLIITSDTLPAFSLRHANVLLEGEAVECFNVFQKEKCSLVTGVLQQNRWPNLESHVMLCEPAWAIFPQERRAFLGDAHALPLLGEW